MIYYFLFLVRGGWCVWFQEKGMFSFYRTFKFCLSVCVSVVLPCDTESECIVLAVTFSSSFSYFWLLFPVTPLPPLLSPFSPSYRGPWGTAESSERVRLSYIRFCFAKQDINISNQSQLQLGDILNNQDICLIIWLVNSINQHCKSL